MIKIFIFLIITSLSFTQNNQFNQTIFVNGKARKATFKVSRSSESFFNRENFFIKKGKIIEIISPDTFLIQNSSRLEEIKLIGLLDISTLQQKNLSKSIKNKITRKYLNNKVTIYKPKNYKDKGLDFNHAYLIKKDIIINLDILKQGLGIIHDGQEIFKPLKQIFVQSMEQAEKKKRGLWGKL
ncbi:MAG: hypothetical protein COB02_05110 [Candidatus Cloacimonadota bacterium]|nr:MAG: hypothetical protein COB02_05110 [Candidatus Cloacimonadota bacterium]